MLFQSLLMLGLILTGLVYIVHPPTGQKMAKRGGAVLLVVIVANTAVSFLWSDGIGRLFIVTCALFLIARLLHRGHR